MSNYYTKVINKILIILSMLITFSSPSYSKDIIYECVFGNVSGYFKVTKNNKKTKIFNRQNAKWIEWCNGQYNRLKILDEGAVCDTEYHKISNDPLTYKQKQTTTFDFLFNTITNVTKSNSRTHKCRVMNK